MVRTSSGEVYIEYSTGEREYYDLPKDPYQLENGASEPGNAGRLKGLKARLERLRDCSGSFCLATEGP